MNKDPFKDLKNQLDNELFDQSSSEMKSQKDEIMTRIQKKSRLHRKKPTYFAANVVIPAVVILLLSVLGSSYLFDQEQVKENPEEQKEPQDQYTYIPTDELEEQIQKDKTEYQKAATPEEEMKQEEPAKQTEEDKGEETEASGKEETIEPENLSAFRYSDIFDHPKQFKEASSEGRIYGTSISLGKTFTDLEKKYGEFSSYKYLETSFRRKENYLLTLSQDQHVKEIEIDKEYTSYKLEQLIDLYGEPYYIFNAVANELYAAYDFGKYRVEFQIEGINKVEDQEDFAVKEIDLGSSITSVNFMKNSENVRIPDYTNDIKYLQDEETLDFNTAWFDAASAEVIKQTKASRNVLNSKEKHITASMYFPVSTSEAEIKVAVNQLLEKMTAEAEKDGVGEELWKTYTYRIFVSKGEGENADYYGSGMNVDVTKPLNESGYPDPAWFDGFQ